MKLSKSKIEYVDYAWNPVWGCKYGCSYCFAKKANDRFHYIPDFNDPQLFTERLNQPYITKKPGAVAVCFQSDLFGDWIDKSWIQEVIANSVVPHLYLFLTKNPSRYSQDTLPAKNRLYGATIDAIPQAQITQPYALDWISFEPLLEDVADFIDLQGVSWIVIGAQTKPLRLPKKEWVEKLIEGADKYSIPVWMKDSLAPLFSELRKEKPWEKKNENN